MTTRPCILKDRQAGIDLESWQEVVNLLARIFDAASGNIVQLRDDGFNVASTSDNEDNFLAVNSTWPWDMKSFCRKMVESGELLYEGDPANSPFWQDAPPVCEGVVRSYLGYPLYWPSGEVFGSICVIDTRKTDYSEDLVALLGQLKKLIEANLRHADDIENLRHAALHDPLTGCGNRLLMEERLINQVARVKRQDETFSLLSIDLDDFKPVNDDYGHLAGDAVLKEIARRLQASIRESDLLVRMGGDEFLIIFSSEIDSTQTMEKLAAEIAKAVDYGGSAIAVTGSFGYGHCPQDGASIDELFSAVDLRMYDNKRAKKSRQ